ncbi:MAG: hypothetical protein IKY34_05885 [Ruminiclostridium sp.]|nr:hypothetical protein [Ruminiclostridium sp.]
MKRLLLISLLSLALCGCQLASEGPQEGQLVGVFFTTDVVSIPGQELEVDNISSDGSIYLTEGQPGGRLYAQECTDEEGEIYYDFPDLDGVAFYQIPIVEEDGQVRFIQEKNQAVQERQLSTSIEDGGETSTVKGILYAPTWGEQKCLFANPMYQTKEGKVYLEATPDAFDCASMLEEGAYVSYTLSSTTTVEISEGADTSGFVFEYGYHGKNLVEKVVFTQMTADHCPIDTQEYPAEQTPECLTVEPETAYLLVESHCINGHGTSYVDRILLDRNDEEDQTFTTYVQEFPGILSRRTTTILWEEVGG